MRKKRIKCRFAQETHKTHSVIFLPFTLGHEKKSNGAEPLGQASTVALNN